MEKKRYFILNRYFFTIIFSIVILVIGGSIYLYYRVRTLNVFLFLNSIGYNNFFEKKSFNEISILENFIVYSIPNGLWLVSAILIFGVIWKDRRKIFFIYSGIFTALSILIEFLQLLNIISGTFDIMDVIVLIVSYITGIIFYFIFLRRENNGK